MGLALVRAMGQGAAFGWIFLSGLLVAPFLACGAGALAARRLGGRFAFADGLLFGAAGGLLGGPLAFLVAAAYVGLRGEPGEVLRTTIESALPGLAVGLVIGACMGLAAAWPRPRGADQRVRRET